MRSANSKPQPSNQPINSPQTQSSPAHICSCSRSVPLGYTTQWRRKQCKFPLMPTRNIRSKEQSNSHGIWSAVLWKPLTRFTLFLESSSGMPTHTHTLMHTPQIIHMLLSLHLPTAQTCFVLRESQ